ncbi:MAG TPA: Rne/Rng family ribonuclease [Bryobacteraceae bacterium]
MSKELVISANRHETKVAILEDDQLVEVFFQRANEYSLAGSIHKGRVTRVLPGMQSAFVDLGLDRDTFLYVTDFFEEENEDFDRVTPREEPRRQRENRPPVEARAVEEAAPEAEPAPDAVEASAAPSEAPAAPPRPVAPSGRPEDGERDRHGRRGRRRRNRGHGFPDSKYASSESRYAPRAVETPSVPIPPPAAEAPTGEPAAEDVSVLPVLPGESLAKYSRSSIQPLDEGEQEEIESLHEPDPEPEPEAVVAPEPEETPVAEAGPVEAPETVEAPVEESAVPEPVPELPVASPGEPEIHSEEIEAAGYPEGSVAETPEDAATPEGEVPPTAPQTAQVREQGGRYMHRGPRRMRRKMRGGGMAESKFSQERRGENPAPPPAPAADASIAKPEPPRSVGRPDKAPLPSISELLKEGQEIIVQIAKEPLGQKGARITSHIALPGRYVVYMPTLEHTGVSRKIASDEERLRLKRILQIHHTGVPGGFIVRTAGEGKTEEELAADMNFLLTLWLDIRQKAEMRPAPLLLHHDLDIVQRTLRDQFTEEFKAIWVDNEELYENVLRFVQRFQPGLVARVKLYTRLEPIFDAFNITAEMEKALRPKVWLKSGGYIVINQTEALVAIDVNTGKYVGRSNRLEDTIVKTNTEAVKEIVRQIRLRDLGGIIVVDFIDMDERKNRQKVMQALEDAMRSDRAPNKILQFNDFGLVAITRKRVKQSLERALCMPCPHCEGAGYVKSTQTIVGEILQEAHKIAAAVDGKDCLLRVHPDVAKVLKSNQNKYLEELEDILRRPVLVKGDPSLHHEKFDLA